MSLSDEIWKAFLEQAKSKQLNDEETHAWKPLLAKLPNLVGKKLLVAKLNIRAYAEIRTKILIWQASNTQVSSPQLTKKAKKVGLREDDAKFAVKAIGGWFKELYSKAIKEPATLLTSAGVRTEQEFFADSDFGLSSDNLQSLKQDSLTIEKLLTTQPQLLLTDRFLFKKLMAN